MIGIKSIIYYFAAAAAAVFGMLLLHNTASVIVAAFVFVYPFFVLLAQGYAMGGITIEPDERNNNAEQGYDRPIYVTIANKRFVPVIALSFEISVTNEFYGSKKTYVYSIPVYPFGRQQLVLKEILLNYAGNYNVELYNVCAWDFLHIYSFPQKIHLKRLITVLPKPYKAVKLSSESFVNENSDTEESSKKGSDYPEVKDVREYIPGDSLKNIHWKLSAKKDLLMVKEHINLASDCIAVIIELTDDGNFLLERIMRTAFTVLKGWTESNVSYRVWWWSQGACDMESLVVNNRDDLYDCFFALMCEKSYRETDLAKNGFEYVKSTVQRAVWINGCPNQPRENIVLWGGDALDEKAEQKYNNKKGRGNRAKKLLSALGGKKTEDKGVAAYVSLADIS